MGHANDIKYGDVEIASKEFHPDEPVFVFRGQDPLSWSVINFYRAACVARDVDQDHIDAIDRSLERFAEWQSEHTELVKDKPDS